MSLYAANVRMAKETMLERAQSSQNVTFQLLLSTGAVTVFSVTARLWKERQQLQIPS